MSEKTWKTLKDIFAKASEIDKSQRSQYLDEVCEGNSALRIEVESLLESFEKSENFIEKSAFEVNKVLSWRQVSEVLSQVLEKPVGERLDFAKELCGNDNELFAEVESLLASEKNTADFFNNSLLASKDLIHNLTSFKDKIIGNYKIIKEIGHGGMGVVYLASRNDDFRKRVALKLVKRGLDSKEVIRRFKNERQILASLHHPNIAQLLDGGTIEDGTPYFVMEYVEGLQLLDFCNERQLSVNERLDLFKTICSAVQHAHQNLVIHRDLKPSNILVTHGGEVKLLDFGVAKFLNPELAGELNQTQTQFRVMTPEYASPEQIKGSHITTASDIYSLGVILYELLTDERPFKFEGKNLEQILKDVTQSEPIAPSSVISRNLSTGDKDQKSKVKNQRFLSGDLDNIVLMALRKEPVRRYQSVQEFSEDIQRYLKGLPVSARPNTFSYRAEKFVRRNLAASVVGALLVLSLIAGLGFSIWQWNTARKESAKTQRINTFLQKTFTEAPFEAKGQNLKFAEVLDTASQRAETELADEPEVKLQVLATLGSTYNRIGIVEKAEERFRAALELGRQIYSSESSETVEILYGLAICLVVKGKLDEAEQILTESARIERKKSPNGSGLLGRVLALLGEINVRKSKLKEAADLIEEAIPLNKKYLGENSAETAESLTGLGRVYQRLGNLAEAEKNFRESLNILRQSPQFRFNYAVALLGLGDTLAIQGKFEEAEKSLLESQTIFKDTQGENSIPTAEMQNYLLRLYYNQNNYQKAESIGAQTRQIFIDNSGKETTGYFSSTEYLGVSLAKNAKTAEGENMLREILEKRLKTAVPTDWRIFNTKNLLAVCLIEQNKFDEAEKLLSESKDFFSKTFGENDFRTRETSKYLQQLNDKRSSKKIQ